MGMSSFRMSREKDLAKEKANEAVKAKEETPKPEPKKKTTKEG
jgi:hypothetical protein